MDTDMYNQRVDEEKQKEGGGGEGKKESEIEKK